MKTKFQLGSLVLFLALAMVFPLDCFTPFDAGSQTMQCCGSMPCNHGNSDQDCCKSMQQSPVAMLSISPDSLLTPPVHAQRTTISYAVVFLPDAPALAYAPTGSPGLFEHAPPLDSSPSISVLRI
jgi:hypothetical protein